MSLSNQNFLFALSAFGVFNGVFLAIYYFFVRPKSLSNFFLGMMLLMLCIRIWKSIFFYFNPELPRIYLQLGLSAYFFVGPFLYFFVREQVGQPSAWLKWQWHLMLLGLVVLSLSVFYPYQHHPQVWRYFVRFIQYQWVAYILASLYVARTYLGTILEPKHKVTQDEFWLLSILMSNFLIWLAHFTVALTSYIAGALSFTLVFYCFGVMLFLRRKQEAETPIVKYANKKIPADLALASLEKLNAVMLEQQAFKNANLTLSTLAKQLGMSTAALSQLLNDNLNKSFSQYVNELRIRLAMEILAYPKAMKMDDLANECGFNSQSTFYAAFKKQLDTTPAKYREHCLQKLS